ncbi:MAG: phospholipase D-like domain-containing protein [Pseudohongiella nitratireducens]|nr:phospholipase D-like domain-containing protein [Pseudohongiella nitratireducens]
MWQIQNTLFWLLPLLVLVWGLLTASHALLHKQDSKAAFGWIALCIILPVAGPILYLLFGINRVRSKAQRDYITKMNRDALDTLSMPPGKNFAPHAMIGQRLTRKGLTSCHEIQIYENGEALYPAMLEAIEQAEKRILLASYIFDSKKTGKSIAAALDRAQRRGVEVKVILDGLGEYMYVPRIGHTLKRLGIDFVRFNPISILPPSLNINMRNHRKMMIVDSKVGFTGGQNIGDHHLADAPENLHSVRDVHFSLTGQIVDELEWAFWKDWHYCTGDNQTLAFEGNHQLDLESETWTRLIVDGPNKDLDKLNHLILGQISAASKRVFIMTPYFLPTLDLMGALIAAELRGVEVTVLLPRNNNIKLADWASRSIIRELLEADVDIRYIEGKFVHSKLLLIDDQYSLIGTANIDPRSLRLNYELAVEVFSADFNARIERYFLSFCKDAKPCTLSQLNSRSLPIRLRDSLAWLFSPYL